ncbi:Uncharacterised protein [Serratia proteamaculans]|nr:Uncharacterised protein [Serratia proteamaculans]
MTLGVSIVYEDKLQKKVQMDVATGQVLIGHFTIILPW